MTVATIANRLPVRRGDDGWELSPGGLVTALRPVMATHTGAWVGWDGGTRGIPATLPDLAVPSRDDVAEYRNLRGTVERHIGRINGQFTEPGSDVPVHYLYRGLPPQQLAAYYASAACLLVTPLIDGMNLVAKEYVTVQHARRGSGALVLSEFTGAAVELREAVPCNPFDVEGLSYRIEHALGLPASVRRTALATMARRIRGHDVHQWVARQLAEIESRGVSPVPAFSA